jgi:hypothetical protein
MQVRICPARRGWRSDSGQGGPRGSSRERYLLSGLIAESLFCRPTRKNAPKAGARDRLKGSEADDSGSKPSGNTVPPISFERFHFDSSLHSKSTWKSKLELARIKQTKDFFFSLAMASRRNLQKCRICRPRSVTCSTSKYTDARSGDVRDRFSLARAALGPEAVLAAFKAGLTNT